MNSNLTLAVIGIRAAALALLLSGNTVAAQRMYTLADLIEAGKATDAHMQLVAEKLKSSTALSEDDWDDLMDRIESDHNDLQK